MKELFTNVKKGRLEGGGGKGEGGPRGAIVVAMCYLIK